VKVWNTIKITLDRDKNEIDRFTYKEYTTDSKGNILDETELSEDGSVACKRIYRYFEDGGVKEFIEYDPFDELIERHTYTENESGEIVRVVYEYGNDHKIVKDFHFADLGLADTATLYDETGTVIGYETYVFNDDDQIVDQIERSSNNTESVRYHKKYDADGNTSEEQKFVNEKLTEVTTYSYESHNKVARKVVKNKTDGNELIDEYEYDSNGNMIHNVSFKNSTVVFENKCTYDGDQNLSTEEFFEIDFWEKRILRHEKLVHLVKP